MELAKRILAAEQMVKPPCRIPERIFPVRLRRIPPAQKTRQFLPRLPSRAGCRQRQGIVQADRRIHEIRLPVLNQGRRGLKRKIPDLRTFILQNRIFINIGAPRLPVRLPIRHTGVLRHGQKIRTASSRAARILRRRGRLPPASGRACQAKAQQTDDSHPHWPSDPVSSHPPSSHPSPPCAARCLKYRNSPDDPNYHKISAVIVFYPL